MNYLLKSLLVSSVLVAGGAASAAPLVNGTFEDGLTGWVSLGNVTIVSSTAPSGGARMAQVTAGGEGVYQKLRQSFTADAGWLFSFDARWSSPDYMPYNDDGYVSLNGILLWDASVAEYESRSQTWESVSYSLPTGGSQLLEIGVRNVVDGTTNSSVLIDNFVVRPARVPEPATLGLIGLGLAAVGLRHRAFSPSRLSRG